MIEKNIVIKIKASDLDSIKRFYHILKDFCKKNVDGIMIREINTTVQNIFIFWKLITKLIKIFFLKLIR